jgi:hypothetical protein
MAALRRNSNYFPKYFAPAKNLYAGGAIALARVLGVGGLERQAARSSRGTRRDGRNATPHSRNALQINGLRPDMLRCTMI